MACSIRAVGSQAPPPGDRDGDGRGGESVQREGSLAAQLLFYCPWTSVNITSKIVRKADSESESTL